MQEYHLCRPPPIPPCGLSMPGLSILINNYTRNKRSYKSGKSLIIRTEPIKPTHSETVSLPCYRFFNFILNIESKINEGLKKACWPTDRLTKLHLQVFPPWQILVSLFMFWKWDSIRPTYLFVVLICRLWKEVINIYPKTSRESVSRTQE